MSQKPYAQQRHIEIPLINAWRPFLCAPDIPSIRISSATSQIGGVLDIIVKNFADISHQEIEEWHKLQKSDPTLISPFYAPEFAGAINDAGKPVKVALVFENGSIIGILPFHIGRLRAGVPVGGQISDYHGIIGPFKDQFETSALLKTCGLDAYDFNHLPTSQAVLARGSFQHSFSPCIDLEEGYDVYYQNRSATSHKELKNTARKYRNLERDFGPIRLELDDQSDQTWQKLITWKNQSFEQMGVNSILETAWARQAFETIRKTRKPYFAGMISSLYAGDELAAVHFGMRSHAVLHWWFPTYNPDLSKFSPGILLLLEIAKQAPNLGILKIDLGRGSQRYKKTFANSSIQLCEGSIERGTSFAGSARKIRKSLDRGLSRFPGFARPAQFQRRAFNRLLGAVYLPK